ncbi:Cytochrome P450 709B2 [Trichoderma ghanense]|uniref:Cytochrome P450 709B2 n=1 Tax=Trichoderma ghanense TaxID=65468 RepID=A0ABY2HHW6_9HYPO
MESLCVALVSFAGVVLTLRQTDATISLAAGVGLGLYILGTIAFKIGRALIYPFYISPLRNVPGPKDNQLLVGQAIRLLRTAGPNDLYLEWVRKWPDAPFIRYLSFGNSEVLLVNSLEAAREVLQTHGSSFVKPAFFEKLVGEMMGTGVLFSVGEQHKQLRRIMAGPLSKPNVRRMLPLFKEKAKELSASFDEAIAGESKGVVEIEALFSRTAFKVISTALLSRDISDFRSKASPLSFEECYKGILAPPTLLGKLITFVNPFIPLRWLPVEANLAFIRANTALRGMLSELVQERVARVKREKGDSKRDFLTDMIEANLAESKGVSDQMLVDIIIQGVSAGHETTAGALTWTIHALTQHPHIKQRLRDEILSAQQKHPDLDAATIDSLPYLNNVLNESLRVYSPTLMAPWEAGRDLVVAGVAIPEGTTVTTMPAMVHLNPSIWGADVDEFNPDRWDAATGPVANPFAIEAFLNGPRTCPGRALALLEMKTVLVEVVGGFELEAAREEGEVVGFENPSLTLKPKGGLWFVDPVWLNFSDLFPHNDTALRLLYSALFAAAAYSSPVASREVAEAFMADTPQHERTVNDVATIRTFWSLFLFDRLSSRQSHGSQTASRPTSTQYPQKWSTWQPSPLTTTAGSTTSSSATSTSCTPPTSTTSPSPKKQAIDAKASNAMLALRKQIDRRLYISRAVKPHRVQVVFWITYHSILVNLYRPRPGPPRDFDMAHRIPNALRSATASAMAITRLLKGLQASDDIGHLPPFIIYHVFSRCDVV